MIAIPNMEKPKGCKECQWHLDFYIEDEQVGGLCTITEKDDRENTCPLIEIDLVRCSECMYWHEGEWYNTCDKHIGHGFPSDYFCADGERRTDE